MRGKEEGEKTTENCGVILSEGVSSGGYGAASGGDVWDGDDELEYVVGDNVEDDGGGQWWTVVVVVDEKERG